MAANLLRGEQRRVTNRIDCYLLYIDPPLGRVGMTERQVRESGQPALVATGPMTRVSRAVEKDETQGSMKVLVDARTDQILGAAILGVGGDEVVHSILDVMYAHVCQGALYGDPTDGAHPPDRVETDSDDAGGPEAADILTPMPTLADWAPNPHALIVHLPIGLLVTAVVADLVAMLRRDPSTIMRVSTGLYLAGTVTLVAAFLTGRSAAPAVYTPGMAQAVVARHWDWALWCVWYFGLLSAGRVGLGLAAGASRRSSAVALAVAGLAGLVLLTNTAELGGRLVYQHGVGVAAPVARTP